MGCNEVKGGGGLIAGFITIHGGHDQGRYVTGLAVVGIVIDFIGTGGVKAAIGAFPAGSGGIVGEIQYVIIDNNLTRTATAGDTGIRPPDLCPRIIDPAVRDGTQPEQGTVLCRRKIGRWSGLFDVTGAINRVGQYHTFTKQLQCGNFTVRVRHRIITADCVTTVVQQRMLGQSVKLAGMEPHGHFPHVLGLDHVTGGDKRILHIFPTGQAVEQFIKEIFTTPDRYTGGAGRVLLAPNRLFGGRRAGNDGTAGFRQCRDKGTGIAGTNNDGAGFCCGSGRQAGLKGGEPAVQILGRHGITAKVKLTRITMVNHNQIER